MTAACETYHNAGSAGVHAENGMARQPASALVAVDRHNGALPQRRSQLPMLLYHNIGSFCVLMAHIFVIILLL